MIEVMVMAERDEKFRRGWGRGVGNSELHSRAHRQPASTEAITTRKAILFLGPAGEGDCGTRWDELSASAFIGHWAPKPRISSDESRSLPAPHFHSCPPRGGDVLIHKGLWPKRSV